MTASKPARIGTNRQTARLTSAATGGKHAVQLARNPGPGSHDGDRADGIPCRPSSRARAQSRAAVRLHRRAGQLDQRHRLGDDKRRHRGGLLGGILSQSPRHARLRHVGSGTDADAGGDRGRYRNYHRPVAEKMGRRLRLGAEAPRHRDAARVRARPGRYRHRAAGYRYARRIHQPCLPRLFRAVRPTGR